MHLPVSSMGIMNHHNGIILTKDSNLSKLFEEIGQGLNLKFESDSEISDYLLKVLDDVFSVIVYDCTVACQSLPE